MTEINLSTATERARRAINLLGKAPDNWVADQGADHDVTIIGGGQSGIAIGFALQRAGVHRFAIFDKASEGASNWNTVARMKTLRTPKTVTGLELGIPELSFRAWYEAQHGVEGFAAITKIATKDWSDYFDWYKTVIGIPVHHGHRLIDVQPDHGKLRLTILANGAERQITTRKLVLATGMGGFGEVITPASIAALPRRLWAHTHDAIDLPALRGKRIGVLGAASGAFDVAAAALEHGAASADLFCRHPELAIQKIGGKLTLITDLAIPTHFYHLPDALRWRIVSRGRARGVVPEESINRAEAHKTFVLHLGAGWDNVTAEGDTVAVLSNGKRHEFDLVIAATGYSVDLASRPELKAAAPLTALWSDRYTPPLSEADPIRARFPYLGPGLELSERIPGTAPWLGDIHVFNFAAILSHGFHVGDISSTSVCVPRLVRAIAKDLFLSDVPAHLAPLLDPRDIGSLSSVAPTLLSLEKTA